MNTAFFQVLEEIDVTQTLSLLSQHFFLFRSSRSQMFYRISDLNNFAKLTGKHLYGGLFLMKFQAWGLGPATLLKKRLQHKCFPVNFQEHLFCGISKNAFYRTTPNDYFYFFVCAYIRMNFHFPHRVETSASMIRNPSPPSPMSVRIRTQCQSQTWRSNSWIIIKLSTCWADNLVVDFLRNVEGGLISQCAAGYVQEKYKSGFFVVK